MSVSGLPCVGPPLAAVARHPLVLLGRRVLRLAAGGSHAFWTGVGLLLVSPALWAGWVADDYLQLLALRAQPGIAGLSQRRFDLFRFATGDPHAARQLIEQGIFPWWVDLRVRLAFFRPLSSLTHALDGWLWPNSSFLMHAHSLLWFGVLLVGVGLCYKALTSSAVAAGLALALFAVDDVHAPVVGWISNRNMVVALALSVPALLNHHRWRRSGQTRAAWFAHGCFALGLAAGEAALTLVAYLAAYALFLETASARRRVVSVLGYLAIVLLWRLVYTQSGYGAVGSGVYVDPALHPGEFLHLGSSRVLVLALALFGAPWSDLWELYPLVSPYLQPALLVFAGGVLVALGALAWPTLRARPTARFWLLGCLGSLLPVCATFPHDRLLLAPSIGGAALLAEVIEHALSAASWRSTCVVTVLLPLHLLLAPLFCGFRAATVGHLDELLRAEDATLPRSKALREQTLVLLNPPLDPYAAYLGPFRELHGIPRPRALYWLATGVSELRVTTLDNHTLSIRPREGYLWSSSQRMLRAPSSDPRTWATPLELAEATFTVGNVTTDGRPEEVLVRFKRDLRDRKLTFMRWVGPGYVSFAPPERGTSVVIPAVDVLAALGG